MTGRQIVGLFVGLSLLCVLPVRGQEPRPASERTGSSDREPVREPNSFDIKENISREAQTTAPRVLKFSGVLLDASGKPVSGEVEVTFTLYKQEWDEEALWSETQRVTADEHGGYTALLGVTQATGIPAELFRSDEARWLGVQVQGQGQQPRTLLVSVPYALKAVEAEKLAGRSASDFVLSESLGDQVRRVIEGQNLVASQATSTGTLQPGQVKASNTSASPTGPAGPMFPPSTFSGTNATQIVSVQQNGSGNGLFAQTASSTGSSAVVGVATSASTSNNQNGVFGFNAGAGAGVAGVANNPSSGVGVYGQSANFAGIFGQTFNPNTNGVAGSANATTGLSVGVSGFSASTNGAGVFGNAVAVSGTANGVQGQTASPNGAGVGGFGMATGVFGTASAPSGFANGVFGQSFSPDGTGVGGFANATSGFALGVSGGTASTNGAGVFGNAIATSGFANGVQGQSSSPNGTGVLGIDGSGQATGVFGHTVIGVGVGGQATAPSGGPAYGVWGDSQSTNGVGVAGYEDATSGFTNGVLGQSVSPNGTGVFGFNNSVTGGVGVAGMANATSGFGADGVAGVTASTDASGVSGNAIATSGFTSGVFGQTSSPSGYGVWGAYGFPNSAPNGVGVKGSIESGTQSGIAGQFVNVPGQGLLLQGISGSAFQQVFSVDTSGNLHIAGNLTVDGTKSSTAKLQDGRVVALYAVESPENWFEDLGALN